MRSICLLTLAFTLLLAVSAPAELQAHVSIDLQVDELTRRIDADPRNAGLYLKRAEQHRVRRRWDQALADYQRAARLEPHLSVVDLARGRMLYEAGRFTEARRALDRFLEKNPGHVDGHVTRARTLAGLGAHLEAAKDFDHAIAVHPAGSPPRPEYYLERARACASAGQLPRAVRGLDEGLARLGPVVTLQLEAIELEVRHERYDVALQRIDLAMAGAPRRESWLVRRGEVLEAAGRLEAARTAWQQALAELQTLPASRRKTPAARKLEEQLQARLQSPKRGPSVATPARQEEPRR